MAQVLREVEVLEPDDSVTGPHVGVLLGDMDAEVIKEPSGSSGDSAGNQVELTAYRPVGAGPSRKRARWCRAASCAAILSESPARRADHLERPRRSGGTCGRR